ncbi:hypothetical protein MUK42_09217 [Musa troglodytarum]|uniref:Uncharacterized protein n=1 Tax=Musa troglodytarum TaxID=320322 RepID=A0A9E7EFD1_9LILI|nr:hypothetical protein MUK42_09217 [Musa troglodytarum]
MSGGVQLFSKAMVSWFYKYYLEEDPTRAAPSWNKIVPPKIAALYFLWGKGSKAKREAKFTFSPCGILLLVPSICRRGGVSGAFHLSFFPPAFAPWIAVVAFSRAKLLA